MASTTNQTPATTTTAFLKEIAIDYTPSACHHSPSTNEIHLTYDHRGGARWRSPGRFLYGSFSASIRCPAGNTSGLNFNIYLSSLEGDKTQDEIDFEFLGNDLRSIQTNFYVDGVGSREKIHELGFDASDGFHEYVIRWGDNEMEWEIDGRLVRREVRDGDRPWPKKAMYLYASAWDASWVDEGRWTGKYVGCDAPYVCRYADVKVPIETAVVGGGDDGEGNAEKSN